MAGNDPPPVGTSGGDDREIARLLEVTNSSLLEIKGKFDKLMYFIGGRKDVHGKICALVTGINDSLLDGMAAIERERQACGKRWWKYEKELKTLKEKIEHLSAGDKSSRETPGDKEVSKKKIEEEEKIEGGGSAWQTVPVKKEMKEDKKMKEDNEKKQEEKKEEEKKKEEKKKKKVEMLKLRGDALVVEPKGTLSYAEMLQLVKADPELKQLGENVVTTRRTLRGGMLIELKKDPAVKSAVFKSLVEKSFGDEAKVRALSQVTVVECRNLDEVTTEDEVRSALQVQADLGAEPMAIRMKKAYGGTQVAVIRLAAGAAKKLLEKAKVKVGWSVCPLKATPRVAKEMERCFRCMGFGHLSRNCEGPDRSDLCRRCGEAGHIAMNCRKQPRCMLCKKENGNDHPTGCFKCPAYQKASQQAA